MRILGLGGDCMFGRAVQLSMPTQCPGDALIFDSCPALYYLEKALRHPVKSQGDCLPLEEIRKHNQNASYLWGDLLRLRLEPSPDVIILNLETAVTSTLDNSDIIHEKAIKYHAHPENIHRIFSIFKSNNFSCYSSPAPYVVSFANNHCLDWGRKGFENDSLKALSWVNLPGNGQVAGAGRNSRESWSPAAVNTKKGSVEIFSFACEDSGVPSSWKATDSRSGIAVIPYLKDEITLNIAFNLVRAAMSISSQNSVKIVSVHWGPNWGKSEYNKETAQRLRQKLSRMMIDILNVSVIYGHSSHHIRGMELYKGRLVIYGAGDLINDYEGFLNPSELEYQRSGAVFVIDVDENDGRFKQLSLIPYYMERLQLTRLQNDSQIWNPFYRRMEATPLKNLQDAINEWSLHDHGEEGVPVILRERTDSRSGRTFLHFSGGCE